MSRKKPGSQSRRRFAPSRKAQVAIAVVLVTSLFAAWTMLAYSGALDSAFRQNNNKLKTVSPASLTPNSPSKEYIFAGGRLVATEEASGCGDAPSAPGNLLATANTATSVDIEWTAPATGVVDHYEIERSSNFGAPNNGFAFVANVNGTSHPDPNLASNTAYLYRVRAFDSANCPSPYSNVDLATTTIFAEDPLQSQVTIISALHVTQLRQAVDAVRVTANIGAASWTNPLDQVRAVHFSELRTKLNQALPLLGFSEMAIDPAIAQGNTVFAAHLQAVREKVK